MSARRLSLQISPSLPVRFSSRVITEIFMVSARWITGSTMAPVKYTLGVGDRSFTIRAWPWSTLR